MTPEQTVSVIEYLRDRYNEELSRYTTIEEKCTKLLTVISILIGLLTAVGAINSGSIFKPQSPPDAVVLFLYICAVLGVGWTWIETLEIFNSKPNTVATKSEVAIQYMIDCSHTESLDYILSIYKDSLASMSPEIDKKASRIRQINKALIILSGFLFLAFGLHFFSNYISII